MFIADAFQKIPHPLGVPCSAPFTCRSSGARIIKLVRFYKHVTPPE
jgi:hypothetical protein